MKPIRFSNDVLLIFTPATPRQFCSAIVGKWVFMGKNLILMGKDGNILGFESLSNIRKILFSPSEPDESNKPLSANKKEAV